jgi:hypothetical protein
VAALLPIAIGPATWFFQQRAPGKTALDQHAGLDVSLKETSTPVRRNRQLIAVARAAGQLILPADDDGSWITASPPGTGRAQRVVRQYGR